MIRNTYSPWAELASLPHLELRREPPALGRLGEYLHYQQLIRLHPALPRRQARAVLCHELRHHEFQDIGTYCGKTTRMQERRADGVAARMLVDIRDLADAMVLHDRHASAVAVELRVSLDVIQTRVERLHPAERAYLRRRLADYPR